MTGALTTGVPEPRVGVVQQGIMGIMATGIVPDMPGYVADFVPVDILAHWIFALATQSPDLTHKQAQIYHVTNPTPLPVDELRNMSRTSPGTPLKQVPMDEWFDLMERDASLAEGDNVCWAGIRAFFGTGHIYWGLDTTRTMQKLRDLGVNVSKCPVVDGKYMEKLYDNWMR